MSVNWTLIGALSLAVAILESPLAVAAYDTWQRSRENERKLDALLAAWGVDPDDPPQYDLQPVSADGGGEESA